MSRWERRVTVHAHSIIIIFLLYGGNIVIFRKTKAEFPPWNKYFLGGRGLAGHGIRQLPQLGPVDTVCSRVFLEECTHV